MISIFSQKFNQCSNFCFVSWCKFTFWVNLWSLPLSWTVEVFCCILCRKLLDLTLNMGSFHIYRLFFSLNELFSTILFRITLQFFLQFQLYCEFLFTNLLHDLTGNCIWVISRVWWMAQSPKLNISLWAHHIRILISLLRGLPWVSHDRSTPENTSEKYNLIW